MKPTLGRIVLFRSTAAQVLPAIIINVHPDESCDLELFGMVVCSKDDDEVDSRFPVRIAQGSPTDVFRWCWPIREVGP